MGCCFVHTHSVLFVLAGRAMYKGTCLRVSMQRTHWTVSKGKLYLALLAKLCGAILQIKEDVDQKMVMPNTDRSKIGNIEVRHCVCGWFVSCIACFLFACVYRVL